MDRKYKPLLPALRSPSGHSEPGELSPSATKRKRMYVKTACDICRVKKTACDGQRPACTPCTKRKSPCTFRGRTSGSDESRSPHAANISNDTDSASIIAALLTAQDSEAHELLDRLRQGRGTVEVLEARSEDDETAWKGPTILPPDQTSFEFELMVRHPVAYPALVPLDSRNEDHSTSEPLQTVNFEEMEHEQDVASDTELPDASDLNSASHGTYEDRLKHIHFARWTKVAITGTEAAAAIANYLSHDHVFLQLFDAELFLKDVAHDYGEFCSSLLVNALLGWSLPSIIDTNTKNKNSAEAAFETALRQLEAQEEMPVALSAIAATELLSLTALYRGDGVRSHNLLRKALSIGQTMGLLVNRNDPSGQMSGLLISNDEEKSKALASWGLFSFITMMSFHCQRSLLEPVLVPAYAFPEPNSDLSPSNTETLPKYMSRLWMLIHEVNSQFYTGDENVSEEAGIAFSSSMLARLLRWADELPTTLARGNRSTQEVMIMHVYLHAAIMTVAHPLVLRRDTATLLDGESSNRTAEEIFAASAMQMHRLVDSHRFHSRISTTNVFWQTALLFSANASIRPSGSPFPARQWRLLRAMDAYADLYPRYPVMQVMFRGLMTMAVEAGLLGSQEAVKLARRLVEKGAKFGRDHGKEVTESGFVADLELALVDRRMALADVLSQRFDEIVMFYDFTHEYRGS